MSKILSVVKLLRPEQWVKNVFVFIPLFFDGKMLEAGHLLPVCVAFAAFCLMASSIYCLNDILDVERDRRHPGKCNRPIASGAVSRKQGVALMATCALLALAVPIAFQFVASLEIILMAYFAMNVAYSLKLKRYPIVDVFIIAVGFVMRIFAGGVSSDIQLTYSIDCLCGALRWTAAAFALRMEKDIICIWPLPLSFCVIRSSCLIFQGAEA